MEAFLNNLAEMYFDEHVDQFGGPGSTFVAFQLDQAPTPSSLPFNRYAGRIVYQRAGANHGSGRIQVDYYDSQMYARCWGALVPWMSVQRWFCETVLPAFSSLDSVTDITPGLIAFQHQQLDTTAAVKCAFLWESLDEYCMYDVVHPLDHSHLSAMARKIAQFHSLSFRLRAERPQFFAGETPDYDGHSLSRPVVEMLERCLQPLVAEAATSSDAGYVEGVGRLQTMLAEFESRLNRPFEQAADYLCRVVCHQHYTQQNAAFKLEPGTGQATDARIVHWQWSGFASLGVDLVDLLIAEGSHRSQRFGRLLNEYAITLWSVMETSTAGTAGTPSHDQIRDEVKLCMALALQTIAKRVLSAKQRLPTGSKTYPLKFWNETRITDTFRLMIRLNLI